MMFLGVREDVKKAYYNMTKQNVRIKQLQKISISTRHKSQWTPGVEGLINYGPKSTIIFVILTHSLDGSLHVHKNFYNVEDLRFQKLYV